MKKLSLAEWAALGGMLLVLAVPRFWHLGSYPGFEYDEGTAAVLAVQLSRGEVFSLVGEKIYRGPILEYLIVPFLWLGLPMELSSRLPPALVNLAGLIGLLALGVRRCGVFCACLIVMLVGLHPWFLAVSRVAHSACLVPGFLLLSAACLLWPQRNPFTSGLFAGLAFHGHLYAALVGLPFCWMMRERKTDCLRWTGGWFAGAFPFLFGNLLNGFAALQVFGAGYEGHLESAANPLSRIFGHFVSVVVCLLGPHAWLDTLQVLTPASLWWAAPVGLAWLGGMAFGFASGKVLREVAVWPALALLAVPLVTKSRTWAWGDWTIHAGLPTYFDVALPGLAVCLLLATERLMHRHRRRALYALGGVLVVQVAALLAMHGPLTTGNGPGRWGIPWLAIRNEVERRLPGHDELVSSVVFGGVMPQLRGAFPGVSFTGMKRLPPTGIYRQEVLTPGRALMVVQEGAFLPLEADCIPIPRASGWVTCSYASPQTLLDVREPWGQIALQALQREEAIEVLGGTINADGAEWTIQSVKRSDRLLPPRGPAYFLGPADIDIRSLPTLLRLETNLQLSLRQGETIGYGFLRLRWRETEGGLSPVGALKLGGKTFPINSTEGRGVMF